jgi:sensor histidine kinase YesM
MLTYKVNTFSASERMKESKAALISSLNDGWLRLLGIPSVAFVITFFFYSEEWIVKGHAFSFCYLTFLAVTTFIWYLNRFILLYFRRTYTSIDATGRRIAIQLFTSLIASAVLSLGISWLFDWSEYWGRSLFWQDYLYNLIVILIFVVTISGIYEAIFYFARWRFSVRETEELKKANLQSQFESLKNQVSPHFLFNSLNTLSSLIEENPETAIRFVNQLSKVYRYLLQSNEKELTTIKEELEFLDAYIFLLKTRFGDGLKMTKELPDEFLSTLIPPLTLQILIENAVKHNIVSASNPLHIEVKSCKEEQICVVNNKQKKTINVASNGLGLANIAAKYKLLNKPAIRIDDGATEFIVSLPIIKN